MSNQLLVFTDLDGTLLDHETYEFDPATNALAALRRESIPLILSTSKTFSEMRHWRAALDCAHPFIIENGSACMWSKNYMWRMGRSLNQGAEMDDAFEQQIFGSTLSVIRPVLEELGLDQRFRFVAFTDLDIRTLSELTGLEPNAARAAKNREFSEPIIWQDTGEALLRFRQKLRENALSLVRGGRFYHVMGDCNKGIALSSTAARFAKEMKQRVTTIALGDSPNDREMLEAADVAVVVQNSHTESLTVNSARTIYTQGEGPIGWQEAIEFLLSEREKTTIK